MNAFESLDLMYPQNILPRKKKAAKVEEEKVPSEHGSRLRHVVAQKAVGHTSRIPMRPL